MLRHRLETYFPERQIIFRTNGEAKMLQFSTIHQLLGVAVLLAVAGWVMVSAAGLVVLNNTIENRRAEISELATAVQKLDEKRAAARSQISDLTTQLKSKHHDLVATVQKKYEIHKQMTTLSEKLELAMARTQEKDAHKNRLQSKIHKLEEEVRAAVLFSKEIASEAEDVKESRDSTVRMVLKLSRDRDQAIQETKRLTGTIGDMQNQIASLRMEQRALLGQIAGQTRKSIFDLESSIRTAGLDVWTLLKRSKKQVAGVGGPFVPEKTKPLRFTGDIEFLSVGAPYIARDKAIDRRIQHWTQLTDIVEQLPFAAPIENFRMTSRFGRRTDPFNQRVSFHSGLDLVGVYRAAVRAPSAGVVIQAGWKGDYGKTVTIDHGFGVTTVYAHLRRIMVKKGERVTHYQQLGEVGSTGRSTSSHLHYEIRYDGKAINPIRFLKAGKNVLKG